jgi:BMFP domain-containing protein YqiC
MADKRVTQLELENRSEFDVGSSTLMLIRTRKE